MKVIFEIPVREEASIRPSFTWLNNKNNWLFIIEEKKFMKTISIDPDKMKEKQVQSTTVADTRVCTSSAWNRDGSVLAMVLDKKQIYFWDIGTNSFTHFKPKNKFSTSSDNKGNRIDLIAWSNVTNKLAICYQTSQILLCNCDKSDWYERFIDKGDSVLSRVSSIEGAEYLDQFACISIDSELLIMTFEGESIYYIQLDDSQILRAKFSPPNRLTYIKENKSQYRKGNEFCWLTYQSNTNQLYFKELDLQSETSSSMLRKSDIVYYNKEIQSSLVDFHWISQNQLILCYSIGLIMLLKISGGVEVNQKLDFSLLCEPILSINKVEDDNNQKDDNQKFRSYELKRYKRQEIGNTISSRQTTLISLVAISDHKLFYFELGEVNEHQTSYNCSFEKVDDLDLTVNLKKINQRLERAEWCYDCSMLAIQLTNGHILVYRTRLQDYNVVSHESRIAYLSGSCEITILNYGSHKLTWFEEVNSTKITSSSPIIQEEASEALTMTLEFQPTVMAIGPKHLAVALNNRVRFYSLLSNGNNKEKGSLIGEQEYISIVVSLSLNSRFIAINFQDNRLKLQPILRRPPISTSFVDEGRKDNGMSRSLDSNEDDENLDERFFPDPVHPERICSFALTEDLLIYTSQELRLNVFSLSSWSIVQVCEHSQQFDRPILKLRPNGWGNKFVCLLPAKMVTTGELQANNVYLYDLYTNSMISFKENKLYKRMFDSQLSPSLSRLAAVRIDKDKKETIVGWPKLNQVLDAIWDTDGRSLLLIERKRIHTMVVLDHTLEREEPIVEHVYSGQKPASYTTLYASQGIVSFQTAVGRVINSTLDSHNDVDRLDRLVLQIKKLRDETAIPETKQQVENEFAREELEVLKGKVLLLKLDYLRSIMPIYSLTKCKEICLHLTSDELFNLSDKERYTELEMVLWKQLASWAMYTQNLPFALFIYRKHGLLMFARVLEQIIEDARHKNLDAKTSVKTRLLVMMDCDISECCDNDSEQNESTGEGRGFY